jgi:hypothetical protein
MTRKITLLKFIFVSVVCLMQEKLLAQADFGTRTPIILNLETDFGATPNDGTDDSYALLKASKFIENKWRKSTTQILPADTPNVNYQTHYIRLEIPAGVYNVAKEISLIDPPYNSYYVLSSTSIPATVLPFSMIYNDSINLNSAGLGRNVVFDNCLNKYRSLRYLPAPLFKISSSYGLGNQIDGLEIVGVGGNAKFKYADSLHIGLMDTLGQAVTYNSLCLASVWSLNHTANSLFDMEGCKNIRFSYIEVNGNNINSYYMGGGTDGVQSGGIGMRLKNCKYLTIDTSVIHHMQLDGIEIADNLFCNGGTHAVMNDVDMLYNTRQALTISMVDSLIANRCKFNYTGKGMSIIQWPNQVFTSPGFGIDFEAHYYDGLPNCAISGEKYVIKNCYFKDCEFIENHGGNIGNDYGSSNNVVTNNIQFNKSYFFKSTGFGIAVKGDRFLFDSCSIHNQIIYCNFGDSVGA